MKAEKVIGLPKSGKARNVALNSDLAAELARYFEWEQAAKGVTGDSYVFPGKKGRTGTESHDVPQARWNPGTALRRLCKRAGLVDEHGEPITTPHGLRATGATLASEAGVNPIIIQHQLGHADLRTTQESYLGAPAPDLLAGYAAVFSESQ